MFKFKDISILLFVIVIMVMIIVPLPGWLLSILILINISLSLIVILVAMNITEPLQFSVLPSLLLVITLFILGLNVSTTRSILVEAAAGSAVVLFVAVVIVGIPSFG